MAARYLVCAESDSALEQGGLNQRVCTLRIDQKNFLNMKFDFPMSFLLLDQGIRTPSAGRGGEGGMKVD